jgi:pimeloyl-ACP methyl ester carboxylesterase
MKHLSVISIITSLFVTSLFTSTTFARERGNTMKNLATIVLVHGAFAENSSWNKVIQNLQGEGYKVIAVPNPLRSVSADAKAVADVVSTLEGDIILVGHSYGGAVISNAALGNPNIKALVFVAGFAPDEGENIGELSGRYPGSTLGETLSVVPLADGSQDFYIQAEKFHGQFAADVPAEEAALMAAAQRPLRDVALNEGSGEPAWKTIPSWFIIPGLDKNIPPQAQQFMAERANARDILTIPGASHAVAVSHADEVAEFILQTVPGRSPEPISEQHSETVNPIR